MLLRYEESGYIVIVKAKLATVCKSYAEACVIAHYWREQGRTVSLFFKFKNQAY